MYLSCLPKDGKSTILVADIVDFTKICSLINASKIVLLLDKLVALFDDLCEKFRLTKVKTIGDSFIVAGNLEEEQPDHEERVIDLGLEMLKCIEELNEKKELDIKIQIRIGINTGTVYAGVIRTNSFSFDVWGQGLEVAELLQKLCKPGKITISKETYLKVKNLYYFEKGDPVFYDDEFQPSYQLSEKIIIKKKKD